ncbi:hypothetical protein MKW92_027712 [Papaver armeniacum]|nr:hypothetical protein MKW92_027712 [Papaver armeniacum]
MVMSSIDDEDEEAVPAIYCGKEFMSRVGSKNTGAPLYYKSLGAMMIKMDTMYLLSEKNLTLCCNAFSPQLVRVNTLVY